jgi:hypothetical protein
MIGEIKSKTEYLSEDKYKIGEITPKNKRSNPRLLQEHLRFRSTDGPVKRQRL